MLTKEQRGDILEQAGINHAQQLLFSGFSDGAIIAGAGKLRIYPLTRDKAAFMHQICKEFEEKQQRKPAGGPATVSTFEETLSSTQKQQQESSKLGEQKQLYRENILRHSPWMQKVFDREDKARMLQKNMSAEKLTEHYKSEWNRYLNTNAAHEQREQFINAYGKNPEQAHDEIPNVSDQLKISGIIERQYKD